MKWLAKKLLVLVLFVAVLFLTACGKKEQTPSEMINETDQFSVTMELVGEVPRMEDFRILQGGCVTEDYAWFIMTSEENADIYYMTKCYVLKYDRATMQEIKRSEVLNLGHGNDITYNPETNELYVPNCCFRQVSVLDADTLEVIDSKTFDIMESYAIDYNVSSQSFVTNYGGGGMIFRDKDLKVTKVTKEPDTKLVTQGICADDKYVYHVFWSPENNLEEPDNMIFVFDWDGNLITKIPIGMNEYEPENISLVGDTFYIGFNDRVTWESGKIYAVKLIKE